MGERWFNSRIYEGVLEVLMKDKRIMNKWWNIVGKRCLYEFELF